MDPTPRSLTRRIPWTPPVPPELTQDGKTTLAALCQIAKDRPAIGGLHDEFEQEKPKTTPIAEYTQKTTLIAEYTQTAEGDANRKFTDRYGHVYHGLTFGDPDGSEDDHLEILFSRVDPPVYGEDSHEMLVRFPANRESVVLPRQFLVMMLADGWNGELSGRDLECDCDHDDHNINQGKHLA